MLAQRRCVGVENAGCSAGLRQVLTTTRASLVMVDSFMMFSSCCVRLGHSYRLALAGLSGAGRRVLQRHRVANVAPERPYGGLGWHDLVIDHIEATGQAAIGESEAGPVVGVLAAGADVPALATLGPHGVAQVVLHFLVEAALHVGLDIE